MLSKFNITNIFFKNISVFPLVTFRVLFGIMMCFSVVRFWLNGWIEQLYINPSFHFKFYGFSWVTEPSANYLYGLFIIIGISSVFIALGLFYRIAIVLFFLAFTYIELIDATYYLNHYYFVSLVSLFLIFTPANGNVSLDVFLKLRKPLVKIASWNVYGLMLLLGIVYFYAGLAKLNYDWLVNALPLKIWLAPHTNLPIIGFLMDNELTAYAFSWGGALFDLSVPFLLFFKRTRVFGYCLVVVFHVFTALLFPIGVFPYVMIVSTIIFFSDKLHEKLWSKIAFKNEEKYIVSRLRKRVTSIFVLLFFLFQLVFPFRYLFYKGDLFWTEQGYRFSWRVMLMEKAGYAEFKVYPNPNDNRYLIIDNDKYLTPQQEKMMNTQPDFILQYAHYLSSQYKTIPSYQPKVTADVFVSLNGRGSRRFVKENINLTTKHNSLKPINWLEKQ